MECSKMQNLKYVKCQREKIIYKNKLVKIFKLKRNAKKKPTPQKILI